MNEQYDPQPTSFSFSLLAGQALRYPGSTHTPPLGSAYLVSVQTQPITNEVVQEWLKQSLTPLIGPEAVAYLEPFASTAGGQEFLSMVTGFRQTLQ